MMRLGQGSLIRNAMLLKGLKQAGRRPDLIFGPGRNKHAQNIRNTVTATVVTFQVFTVFGLAGFQGLSMESDTSSPNLVTLQAQISVLSELHSQVQSIRTIPPFLLRPPPPPFPQPLQELREFAQTLKSDGVQDALRAAGESEKADGRDISIGGRREIRRRRYAFHYFREV
jgi:hypothetical protein